MAESYIQNFNHLKIHSQFSICEGALKIDDLKDISASNLVSISMFCRHSKSVPVSLIHLYQNLDFLALEHRIPIWLGFVFGTDWPACTFLLCNCNLLIFH